MGGKIDRSKFWCGLGMMLKREVAKITLQFWLEKLNKLRGYSPEEATLENRVFWEREDWISSS